MMSGYNVSRAIASSQQNLSDNCTATQLLIIKSLQL